MNDEQFLLANAYLDGELTADERRIAEADPAVMAEVEQLRGLQAQVRAVDSPTDAARERAIAAAMTEFRRGGAVASAAAAPAPARAPIPFRPRPSYARYLAVAAAVVAVGALGVIVSQAGLGGGDDDDAGDFAAEPAEQTAEDAAADEFSSRTATAGDGAEAPADEAIGDGDDPAATMVVEAVEEAGQAELAVDDGGGDDAGGDVAAEEPAEAAADEPPATYATSPPDFDPEQPITEPIELGAFGRFLLDQQDADLLPPTPNTACDPEFNILGNTTYLAGDDARDVYVGVLEAARAVLAIDRDDCDVVLEGPLTEPTGG